MKSRGRTITETDVVAFSALTGDHHPQHTDALWAADSSFGGRVAHGMLVLSYAVGLVDLDPDRVVALRGIEKVVFKRPVQIGDTIHVESKLVSPDEGRGLEGWEWRILNHKDELVVRAQVEAVVRGEADSSDRSDADSGDDADSGGDSDSADSDSDDDAVPASAVPEQGGGGAPVLI